MCAQRDETQAFYYEPNGDESLSTEVVTAVAKAYHEDVHEQDWCISDEINTDALDGLFQQRNLDMTLRFEADGVPVSIVADIDGKPPTSRLNATDRFALG